MPLDKHRILGLPPFRTKIMAKRDFMQRLESAGYTLNSTMPSGKLNRIKFLFIHDHYPSVMAVYDPKTDVIVTAYQLEG
jgi:hypothetical protein